jgi:hypothetical protein
LQVQLLQASLVFQYLLHAMPASCSSSCQTTKA